MGLPEVGSTAVVTRTFSQGDFDRFAVLSGDDNPIHVDLDYAAASAFGRPVAHGMFLYSCLCGFLAEEFPGAVQERQDLKFPAPTFTGEEMTLLTEVMAVDGRWATVSVEVIDPEGTVTCTGETRLRWREP